MRTFILICLLLIGSACYAQSLSGVITDAQKHRALFPVTVFNTATQKAVYTNEFGAFSISASAGQKIYISYVGYKNEEILVTEENLAKPVQIKMQLMSYELDEFVFHRGPTQYQKDSAHRRDVYSRTLEWKRSSSIASPFSFVADRLSHDSKARYRFQKNYNKWEDEKFVDTRYTPALVAEQTGLSGDSLAFFMNSNPMPYDYARSASEMELKMWIRYQCREWRKNPVILYIDSANIQQDKK